MVAPVILAGDQPPAAQWNQWFVNTNYVYKAADQSVTSNTTMGDDAYLTLPVDANTSYFVTLYLRTSGGTTGNLKWQFTGPAGSNIHGATLRIPTGGSPGTPSLDEVSLASAVGIGLQGVGVLSVTTCTGILNVGATAGTFTLQWAQNVSNGTASTVNTGSFLDLVRKS